MHVKKYPYVLALLILMTGSPVFGFFGGVIFDPVAKIQRAIMIVEQKIQTFKAFQIIH
mgnify:CR=1 FL=1